MTLEAPGQRAVTERRWAISFQEAGEGPFSACDALCEKAGTYMSTPIGAIGASTAAQYVVAVMRKEQDQQAQQGQQAMALIQSASASPSSNGSVGTQLDIIA